MPSPSPSLSLAYCTRETVSETVALVRCGGLLRPPVPAEPQLVVATHAWTERFEALPAPARYAPRTGVFVLTFAVPARAALGDAALTLVAGDVAVRLPAPAPRHARAARAVPAARTRGRAVAHADAPVHLEALARSLAALAAPDAAEPLRRAGVLAGRLGAARRRAAERAGERLTLLTVARAELDAVRAAVADAERELADTAVALRATRDGRDRLERAGEEQAAHAALLALTASTLLRERLRRVAALEAELAAARAEADRLAGELAGVRELLAATEAALVTEQAARRGAEARADRLAAQLAREREREPALSV